MEQIPIGDRPDNVVPFIAGREAAESPEAPEEDVEAGTETEGSETTAAIGPMIEEGARIVAGFLAAIAAAASEAVRAGAQSASPTDDEDLPDDVARTPMPPRIGVAAGAAAGLAVEVTQATLRAASAFAATAGPMLSWFANAAIVRKGVADVDERMQQLNDRWEQERGAAEEAAGAFAANIVPRIVDAVLERIDLTQMATERLDVDAIVASIDLDRILEQIDVNAIIERVDVNAIIDRIDLAALADEVISEIDLPEIIRGSTTAVTSETMRSVRIESAEGDQAVQRLVDRILRRSAERDTDAPEEGP